MEHVSSNCILLCAQYAVLTYLPAWLNIRFKMVNGHLIRITKLKILFGEKSPKYEERRTPSNWDLKTPSLFFKIECSKGVVPPLKCDFLASVSKAFVSSAFWYNNSLEIAHLFMKNNIFCIIMICQISSKTRENRMVRYNKSFAQPKSITYISMLTFRFSRTHRRTFFCVCGIKWMLWLNTVRCLVFLWSLPNFLSFHKLDYFYQWTHNTIGSAQIVVTRFHI